MERAERIELFREMIDCCDQICYWCYDSEGKLLYTDAGESRLQLEQFLTATNSLERIITHGKNSTMPALIGINLGLNWIVAYEPSEIGKKIHILGPLYNYHASMEEFRKALRPWEDRMTISQKYKILDVVHQLPVLTYSNTCRYAVMLHYILTGEKLQTSDVVSIRSSRVPKNAEAPQAPADYHRLIMAEKQLLRTVREGDINFADTFHDIEKMELSMFQLRGTPLEHTILSQIILTALTAQAAVEGGLSVDVAYSLANNHIRDIQSSKSVPDARVAGRSMFRDFVLQVHKNQFRSEVPPEIKSCCDYILLHLEEPLTLQQLAERAGYTPYYFARRFKKEMHCALSNYMKAARIERSKGYLESTDMTIPEIAERLQFSSRNHYADIFRELTGISPAAWRQKNRVG